MDSLLRRELNPNSYLGGRVAYLQSGEFVPILPCQFLVQYHLKLELWFVFVFARTNSSSSCVSSWQGVEIIFLHKFKS